MGSVSVCVFECVCSRCGSTTPRVATSYLVVIVLQALLYICARHKDHVVFNCKEFFCVAHILQKRSQKRKRFFTYRNRRCCFESSIQTGALESRVRGRATGV